MNGIERQYLRECIGALCEARSALIKLKCEDAIARTHGFGKSDTLLLDAIPEHAIIERLCKKFDPYLPFITEEIGSNVRLRGTEEEVVCFSDPMDRSKTLEQFLQAHSGKRVREIFEDQASLQLWESRYGGDIEITGPYGSITAIRHHHMLFNVMINYITGMIYISSDERVGCLRSEDIFENREQKLLKRSVDLIKALQHISFGAESVSDEMSYRFAAYCEPGSRYEDNLRSSKIFEDASIEQIRRDYLLYDIPGGPARILYLKDSPRAGFILSNGEKIGEWIGWLSYVRHCWPKLRAYEISFDSSWTRDQILMAPGPAYSILGDQQMEQGVSFYKNVQINISKLRYLGNPSRYRSTILICPESNEELNRLLSIKRFPELRFSREEHSE